MHLLNSMYQKGADQAFRADGSLGNTSPKLILPRATSRSFLSLVNTGSNPVYLEHGCARATATLTNGVVTSVTVLNGGFGFVLPPQIQFKGGGGMFPPALTASGWDGRGQIDDWPVPSGANLLTTPATINRFAKAYPVLTSGVVTSVVIQDGGAGYINPPEVLLINDPLDPYGCADPSLSSGSGLYVTPYGSYYLNGTFCHTDAIALYTPSGTGSYYVEYSP